MRKIAANHCPADNDLYSSETLELRENSKFSAFRNFLKTLKKGA